MRDRSERPKEGAGFLERYGWSSWGELALPIAAGLIGTVFVILADIEQFSLGYYAVVVVVVAALFAFYVVQLRRKSRRSP